MFDVIRRLLGREGPAAAAALVVCAATCTLAGAASAATAGTAGVSNAASATASSTAAAAAASGRLAGHGWSISLTQRRDVAKAGHIHTFALHRGKQPAVCRLKITSPSGKSKSWRYPKGARTISFAVHPAKRTLPGIWKLHAKCVRPKSVTTSRTSASLKVVTGRHHGHRFLVGKRGPTWVIKTKLGDVTSAPPVLDGGRGGDPGDDYPWKNVGQDSGLDPWGEYYRECTSFVAWALHSRNNFNMPFHDNAYNWGIDAQRLGYRVDDTPAVGAVAWEPKLPNHEWGHVMWVSSVNGNQVTVEEYNEHGNGTYDKRTYTQGSQPYHYIHFKDIAVQPPSVPNPPPPTSPPSSSTRTETTGSVAATWTNYANAGGIQGPSIAKNQSVKIACKVTGFRVADGNTWWYQIASSPWNNSYYVSADAFYNNGATSGSLSGTPFVDTAVAIC